METPRWDSSMGFSTPAPQAAGGTCWVLVTHLGNAICANPTMLGLLETLWGPKES